MNGGHQGHNVLFIICIYMYLCIYVRVRVHIHICRWAGMLLHLNYLQQGVFICTTLKLIRVFLVCEKIDGVLAPPFAVLPLTEANVPESSTERAPSASDTKR